MKNSKIKKNILIVIGCALVFYAVSVPFRLLFTLDAVTEVRPAAALPPFFGLIWGVWGALGAAIGNLFADIQSGFAPGIVAVGFVLQFLYGFVPHVLWDRFLLKSEKKSDLPRMDSTAHIIKYLIIDIFNILCMSVSLGITMEVFGIGKIFSTSTLAMLLNNSVFTIILGIPLLILFSVHRDGHLSLNARVALFCVMQGVTAGVLVGIAGYLSRSDSDTAIEAWNRVFFSSFAAFIIFFGISIFFLRYMEKQVTIPAEKLSKAASEYLSKTAGKPDHDAFTAKCDPLCNLNSEIGTLARSFEKMVSDIKAYMENLERVTADKERINAELNVAKQIQAGMLPCIFPAFPEHNNFDIYARMDPAKEVGGDFYDFFPVDDDHICFVIADVSGKGVPAALFMVIAKTLIKTAAQTGLSPKEIFEKVNNQLFENNEAEMFVTAWIGITELSSGKTVCADAGHEYPALRRKGHDYELIKNKHGFVLAGLENMKYREYELTLLPGDTLFVYTDGVTEATDKNQKLYGTDRMLSALNKEQSTNPQEIILAVKSDIDSFVGQAPQFDDITMMSITYFGSCGKERVQKMKDDSDSCEMNDITVEADSENLHCVLDFIEGKLKEKNCPDKFIMQLCIAAEEIFVNIANYAYHPDSGKVTVGCCVSGDPLTATVRFSDRGKPFDPSAKPDADIKLSAKDRKIGGLGILMTKKLTDEVLYEYKDGCNILTFKKKI